MDYLQLIFSVASGRVLTKWQKNVIARTGFDEQAKMMIITQETLHRIKVNGNVCNSLCTLL